MLRWRAGFNGGFSQTFFIEYRRRDEEKWKVIHIKDHNQNTYSIDGLTPETEYLIRLFSRNIKGDSGLSDAIPFITGKYNHKKLKTIYWLIYFFTMLK